MRNRAELQVDLGQVAPGLDARCSELVRDRVEHRPVGGDVGTPPRPTDDVENRVDEPAEAFEAPGCGPARVRLRVPRVDELRRLDHMTVRAHPLEDARADEDVGRRDAERREIGYRRLG